MGFVVYLVSFDSVVRENGQVDSANTVVLSCIELGLEAFVYDDRDSHDFLQVITTQRGS